MIRTLWAYGISAITTVFYGTEVFLRSQLRLPGTARACWRIQRHWSASILWASGVKVVLEGMENLDRDRPQVVVANHASWFDVWALCAHLPIDYHFVAKKELKKVPFFGQAWQACGHISVDRGDHKSAVGSLARTASEVGDSRSSIVIFPEGTRSDDGSLRRFKKGAFVLALQAGVPIVPVGIIGTRHVMAKGSKRIRSGTVRIRFGTPLEVEGLPMSSRDELVQQSRSAVEALLLDGPT